jgi:uncharacterized protein
MPYFALLYDTVDNFGERRLPYREAHLAQIDEAYQSGHLVLAGALKRDMRSEPVEGPAAPGALLVFRVDDAASVEAFAKNDPYVINGLVTRWHVHEWAVVVGKHAVPR